MTREEAINEIKSWDFLEGKEIEAIHTLIPELRESEDERIRKLLVWQVYRNIEDETNDLAGSVYDGIKGHDPDLEESIEDWKKCLAYLEKQKENTEKEYVFRPLAGTDITIAAEQAIRRANEGDRLVLAFNGAYIPVRKGCDANKIVDIYDAFIEKQKEPENTSATTMIPSCWEVEQKPVQTVDEKEYVSTLKNLISGFIRDKQPEDVAYYQRVYDWLDGRHIEQKPAEWDDYTKTNLGRAIQIIKDARGTLHGYQTDDGIYECDKAIEALEHFLYRGLEIEKLAEWSEDIIRKAIKEVGLTQHQIDWFKTNVFPPKPEWSEEDEGMLNCIIATLCEEEYGGRETNDKMVTWLDNRLKSLRPQPKQEWSEEDEIYLQDALWCVEKAEKSCKDEEDKGACWSAKRWLKSLRPVSKESLQPHWKPSEEQMEALQRASVNEYLSAEQFDILVCLYEQLKKLGVKEEPEYYQHFDPDC